MKGEAVHRVALDLNGDENNHIGVFHEIRLV